MKKLTYVLIALALLASTGIASAATVVYQDEAAFVAATGAAPVPFPSDAWNALPLHPWALLDYSCTNDPGGIDLGSVTVRAPAALQGLICVMGPGWNTPPSNTDPKPLSTTIMANGEDDYLLVNFASPVYAVGFKLLTNSAASEIITLTFMDGTAVPFDDTALGTNPNTFEFVGFKSDKPIVGVTIDTTGGAQQNEGIAGIWVADKYKVDIDIKPGSDPNCFNNDDHGVIPVAILGSADFDVTQIDPGTVQLAGLAVKAVGKSNKLLAHVEDVNGDGFNDLVVQIQDADGTWSAGTSLADVTGALYDGTPIFGQDYVCITQ